MTRRISIFRRMMCGPLLAACLAVAWPPMGLAKDFNRGLSIKEYEAYTAREPGGPIRQAALRYVSGMLEGFRAAEDEYGGAGRAPLFCTPDDLAEYDLLKLADEELAADGQTWRRASDATAAKLLLYVIRTRFPCPLLPADAQPIERDPMERRFVGRGSMHVWFFQLAIFLASSGDKAGNEMIFPYFFGWREGLMAAGDVHVAGGAKPRVCIPPNVDIQDLFNAVADEVASDKAYETTRSDESLTPIALRVFAKKWPCK